MARLERRPASVAVAPDRKDGWLYLHALVDPGRYRDDVRTMEFADGSQVRLTPWQLQQVAGDINYGWSARNIAECYGVRRQAVTALRQRMEARRAELGLGPYLCPCGRPASHRGRCEARR